MTFNEIILSNIESRIAPGIRPVKYLIDILRIEKEAAYRRIRNLVPFTFTEVITIAKDLNFSIDDIIDQHAGGSLVQFNLDIDFEKQKSIIYLDMMQNAVNVMKDLYTADKLDILLAINRIPWNYLIFPILFKFEYFRYMHTCDEVHMNTSLNDIVIPPEIMKLQKQASFYCSQLSNVTCVFDCNMLKKTLDEIVYFYKRKSLTLSDLRMLKRELCEFIEHIVRINRLGRNEYGAKYDLYWSNQAIDTNCVFYAFDGKEMEQIWVYFEGPIIVRNNEKMARLHRNYIQTCIKYSTPLTCTNDLQQAQVYEDSINMINDMLNEQNFTE
jgi:hypothetical protein